MLHINFFLSSALLVLVGCDMKSVQALIILGIGVNYKWKFNYNDSITLKIALLRIAYW